MKKSDRIESFIDTLPADAPGGEGLHRCYTGYFECFNQQLYYEAHDVLEHLWLSCRGTGEDAFYKGLIQLAGAFVHLKKQHLRPDHPKDGRRLRPAFRLLHLVKGNLAPYPAHHHRLDLLALQTFCDGYIDALEAAQFRINPWSPAHPPHLALLSQ